MKKIVEGWEFEDYDGHAKPFASFKDRSLSYNDHMSVDIDVSREFDNSEVSTFVPVEVMAEYLRMLGYRVEKELTLEQIAEVRKRT